MEADVGSVIGPAAMNEALSKSSTTTVIGIVAVMLAPSNCASQRCAKAVAIRPSWSRARPVNGFWWPGGQRRRHNRRGSECRRPPGNRVPATSAPANPNLSGLFLNVLLCRGFGDVKIVFSNAHEGLKAAIAKTFWHRGHRLENALARVPKSQQAMVSAAYVRPFLQSDAASASQTWRHVADQLRV